MAVGREVFAGYQQVTQSVIMPKNEQAGIQNVTNGSHCDVPVEPEPEMFTNANATAVDERCGYRGSCCKRGFFGPCTLFQPLATAKWALGLFCVSNLLQQTVISGLYGVSVSTLEKRFELRSLESGFIASSYDFARVVGVLLLIFGPTDLDKPRWIGYGSMLAGIGSVMFSLPHFFAPEYSVAKEDVHNYCGNVTGSNCGTFGLRSYWIWFALSVSVLGFGGCPLFVHGITYLDENVKKKNSALYHAIYLAFGGIGPAIGFVCGGAALNWHTYISAKPEDLAINSSDSQWVGAWWIGFLICGVILVLFSVLLLLLPKSIPGAERYRRNRDVSAQRSHLLRNADIKRSGARRTVSEVYHLLKNRPYIFMTLGMTMNSAFIYGFNTFGAKYMECVFGLRPYTSSMIYGVSALVAAFGGQIISGCVIKKLDAKVPRILKFIIATGIISAICSVGFIVHCDEIDFAGGTVAYPNLTGKLVNSPFSSCNRGCDCTRDRYQPVCAEGTTYFSPCFAGCKSKINETAYSDCSCVTSNGAYSDVIASSDLCDENRCNKIYVFVVVVTLCFFTSLLSVAPAIQVTVRCVPFESRDQALLLQGAIIRLVGVIPGRLLVGYVLDLACVSWSTECGEQGACKAYRRWEVSRNNTLLLLGQTVICAVFYCLVYYAYEPAGSDTNIEQDADLKFTEFEETDGLPQHEEEEVLR